MVFPELGNTCQGHTALQRLLQSLRLVLSSENIKCLCVVGFPVKILRRIGGLDLKYIVWAMPASSIQLSFGTNRNLRCGSPVFTVHIVISLLHSPLAHLLSVDCFR